MVHGSGGEIAGPYDSLREAATFICLRGSQLLDVCAVRSEIISEYPDDFKDVRELLQIAVRCEELLYLFD
jgi:hypothetical protein